MAQQSLIKEVGNFVNEEVILTGWVRNIRSSGKLQFIILRDGSGEIQVVAFKPNLSKAQFEKCENLTMESSVKIWGKVKEDERSPSGYELDLTDIEIIQIAAEYPIQKKSHGVEFLLDNRHLWVRSRKQIALLKIRHTVYHAITTFLDEHGFYRYDSPILTPNACEGTTTLFEVPYFDQGKAYLSQSGQLYAETGIMSLRRVYDFGPTFRAEKSKTRKHLTEFWMMDAEAAFVKHKENMRIQEELIRFVIQRVVERNKQELNELERDIDVLKKADAAFMVLTHKEAIDFLKDKGYDISYDDDFGTEEEEAISKNFDVPTFIEKWPKHIKAFYMKTDPENEDLALCDDLIAPEGFGEIIGGSEREEDYNILKKRMQEDNLPLDEYQWYLDLRKYGTVPHSGFGVGLERLIGWLAGIRHIRQTIPFPRMINRISP